MTNHHFPHMGGSHAAKQGNRRLCAGNHRHLLFGGLILLIAAAVLSVQDMTPTADAQTIPTPTHQLWLPNVQQAHSNQSVTSPDGQLRLHFQIDAPPPHIGGPSQLHYSVSYRGATILEPSRLGITFSTATPDFGSLEVGQISVRNHEEWYTLGFGERRDLHDHFNDTQVHIKLTLSNV